MNKILLLLQKFLLLEEIDNVKIIETQNDKKATISIEKVKASWINDLTTDTLNDISVTINNNDLSVVVGNVGAGKV
jgi:ABC-type bacteriocin/lantibiotic exporter with double-glycine peptidase domain